MPPIKYWEILANKLSAAGRLISMLIPVEVLTAFLKLDWCERSSLLNPIADYIATQKILVCHSGTDFDSFHSKQIGFNTSVRSASPLSYNRRL